ncbi:hypothetical protein BGZ54_005096, partial [Gamsiella multidivaricata]
MSARCKRYKENYVKALAFSKGTGNGLTDDDLRKGIPTMEQKRDYSFTKMYVSFGSSPSIEPLSEVSTSALGVTFRSKTSQTTITRQLDTHAAVPSAITE